ncbi:cysteine proteinase inhibitor 1-like [Pyrus ussuriensis x Pyrus communis]|uniref:Cysteine proteinase inhibitor 1-like n=1 Tax=Pyrus ussuriensis x Pyrus communis TaxID=2448454 RepID=A0A5N5HZU7_9ROSA|nr:cysteine proteinase inhibitor 1-like [Pyrus ussuriensis x Pyrus communis]
MRMYHPRCRLLILSALLYLSIVATAYGVGGGEEHHYPPKYQPLRGGYYPIENLNDPHLREIAEFAISEYNKIHDQKLVFQKLVRGESQTIAGINYKLVIEVMDSSSVNSGPISYEIIVFEDLSRTTKLESFVRVQN